MYTRIRKYRVAEDKKEEFLDIMQELADTYLNRMGGRMIFLRSLADETEWTVLEQFSSQELYEKRIQETKEFVAAENILEGLDELLLEAVSEDVAESYMFMEVSAEE